MTAMMKRFWLEDEGQDLIEYTLLLAFVALAAAAMFIGAGSAGNQIWSIANTHMNNAASAAS